MPQAERAEGGVVVEVSGPHAQWVQRSLGELVLAQVIPSGLVEVVVGVGGTQELEEVDAALRGGGGKEGEVLVADVGGVAVLAAMARPGVIDVNVGAGGEPCGQELVFFAVEGVVVLDEHTVELARGDLHAPLS